MNVEELDDDCRRILLRLNECDKTDRVLVDFQEMAKYLKLTENRISIAYDRLEQKELILLDKAFSGEKWAHISRDGRVAANDLLGLPAKQRWLRCKRLWSLHYEKLIIPILVTIVAGFIVFLLTRKM